jgi:protein-tyrosine phosphatase
MTPITDRVLRLEGARNVRDLGGLPTRSGARTRYGVVYRADGLSRLTDADLARLERLALRTIIDLRHADEQARAPDRMPLTNPPTLQHCGFLPQGTLPMFDAINTGGADAAAAFELMCRNYACMPFDHAGEFGRVLRHVVAPGTAPHLIHCTSGKDRTGLAAAFILLAVGVDRDDVIADYELSNGDWQALDVFGPGAREEAVATVMAAKADYLMTAFDAIDRRCGSFEAYLADHLGFDAAAREALVRLLVEAR